MLDSLMTNDNKHYHHHHHQHRHHYDSADEYKMKTLNSIQRRKAFAKIFFGLLSLCAIFLIIFVYWLYTND